MNRAVSIVCRPFLGLQDLTAIGAGLGPLVFRPAETAAGAFTGQNPDVRSAETAVGLDPLFLDRIAAEVGQVNDEVFGFAIDGFRHDDPVTLVRYRPGDHFVWHLDNSTANPPVASRKLSFTVQFSPGEDYDGGDLEFAMYAGEFQGEVYRVDRAAARAAGTLIVFPSFHLHRVRPVTRGTRLAIVGWLHGPPFQ